MDLGYLITSFSLNLSGWCRLRMKGIRERERRCEIRIMVSMVDPETIDYYLFSALDR